MSRLVVTKICIPGCIPDGSSPAPAPSIVPLTFSRRGILIKFSVSGHVLLYTVQVDKGVMLRFPDHDVTPDLVRETEPTYINEYAIDKDQVSLIKNLLSAPVQIGFRFRFWI